MDTIEVKPSIHHVENPQELAQKAFDIFCNSARKAIDARGKFFVAISGGHTPEGFFELLADNEKNSEIDWTRIQLFWVDERCVPPEADASNYGLAAHLFLERVPIPESNIHRISGERDILDQAVKEYEETIFRAFSISPGHIPCFDMVILGMGRDGHVASLYPNSYAQFDTEDIVTTVYLMDGNYNRITLTSPVLTAARKLMILISGPEKAEIVKEVLQGPPDEVKYPVHTLWTVLDKISWIIDAQAGKLIR